MDVKQMVLTVIYTEYQKNLPDMAESLWPAQEKLGIDNDVAVMALKKLHKEGYITDPGIRGSKTDNVISLGVLQNMMITRDGIQYVERLNGIVPTETNINKVEKVRKSFSEQGLDVLTDFAAKVTAELIKIQIK